MSYDTRDKVFKRVVPWFSMSEWVAVFKLVYSDDREEQQIGLDRMIGWKARCPKLPLGAECTLGIVQVLLEDPDNDAGQCQSIAREQQLRLIYSTAVMRFLNLMFAVRADEELQGSLYMKAAQLNIPEWIINLRHNAAHGVSLPELGLLRTAAKFIFKWLHEHYWVRENHIVKDWKVTASEILAMSADERELGSIMESWEALSLYELAGFGMMHMIPDNELRISISSIHQILCNDTSDPSIVDVNIQRSKVSTARTLVLHRLVHFCQNTLETFDKATLMAKSLVEGEFFLPSKSVIKLLYPTEQESEDILQQLPQALSDSCADLMSTFWKLEAMPALCLKLISVASDSSEPDLRRNFAALWIQKIILSYLKVREMSKLLWPICHSLSQSLFAQYRVLTPNVSKKVLSSALAMAAVDHQRPDLKTAYTWKTVESQKIPSTLSSLDLLRQCFDQPSKFICIFLPSLMELTSPSIPLRYRELLLDLMNTFNKDDNGVEEKGERKILSVNDLHNGNTLNSESGKAGEDRSCYDYVPNQEECVEQSRWTLRKGYMDWHKCPLGILPWQREQDNLDKEECAGKQRTWPEFLLPGDWTAVEKMTGQACVSNKQIEASLRKTKAGRVAKTYNSPSPMKFFNKNMSPGVKAMHILSSL